jgi:hypothetical protein
VIDAGELEREPDVACLLADQVGAAGSDCELERELGIALALAAAAQDDVERSVEGGNRPASGGGIRRLRVVHEAHALDLADRLEPVRDAREGFESLRDPRVVDTERTRGSGRGGSVLAVVRAGNARLSGQRAGRLELDAPRAARNLVEPDRHHRGVVLELVLEDPQLCVAIGVDRSVPVEVVGLEVEEQAHVRAKPVDVLQLEARDLADHHLGRRNLAVEIAERAAHVSRDRCTEHRSEQLARRRLPVRPGDADDRVREQSRPELDLAPDRDPAGASRRDERHLAGHSRALDHGLDDIGQALLLGPETEFDTGLGKPARVDVRRRIDSDHLLPASPKRERRRLPRPRQAQDKPGHRSARKSR